MQWIQSLCTDLWGYLARMSAWEVVGFCGQVCFLSRFVVQWIVTERRKQSTIPVAFWYLSLAGTIVLLTYSIHLRNPVFILGFSLNMLIYVRNLYFIHRKAPATG
ncbi:MAG TPA: lipid-A-disaccharide synthase N-terminal domain-containing protein [Phycisphaerae bacterium]|nr:lipid-A-disaccharide synthase N-terminal domain-containing protein [Phycisphaerae bacterium]